MCLLVAAISCTAISLYAQHQPLKMNDDRSTDTLITTINKNHKTTSFITGGAVYLLDGIATNPNLNTFDGYACSDSISINASQSKLLAMQLQAPSTTDLQALCLFSPNIGVEIFNIGGASQKYLVAFDCEQIALVAADSLVLNLAATEQIIYLQQLLDSLFNYRSQKPKSHEWIPLRKE